ncbi:MAG: XRE family transcriptional regulator [Parcubacteria group bacterium GW2011_GWA2_56_7]|nr:MAG: XRE family transcriptional regulator [Parcubacteria group bacterium GW2011_GWA2_56_7]
MRWEMIGTKSMRRTVKNASMSFTIRALGSKQSLGKELHAMRRRFAYSLDQAVAATKIQKCYIEALENDAWDRLPEPLYTRNFLKAYAQYLGVDHTYILSRFEEERGCCDFLGTARLPRQRLRRRLLQVRPRLLKFGFLALLFAVLLGYMGFQLEHLRRPPELIVLTPQEGTTIEEPTLTITGEILEEATVKINGYTVLPDQTGRFMHTIVLERGTNIVTIEGRKRYSRPAVVYRTVVFDASLHSPKLSLP